MRLVALLLFGLAAPSLWAADVYRSVAADGTVIYSDRPSGPDAEPVFVAAVQGSTSPSPALEPERAAAEPPATIESAADARRFERELAEQRERNCAIAQLRAQNYTAAHRLYRELPNGEREYLDDAQIGEARAQAAADVEAWCS